MSVYCFCNKIKDLFKPFRKNKHACLSLQERGCAIRAVNTFLMWKRPCPCPAGLCLPGGFQGLPGLFPGGLPFPSRKPQDHPKRKYALWCQSSFCKMDFNVGLAIGGQSPGDAAASWEAELGPPRPPLATRRLVFLPLRAIWQYHRLSGKSGDPQASQAISAYGYCVFSLAYIVFSMLTKNSPNSFL